LAAAPAAALVWAFWSPLWVLIKEWNGNEDYSVGMLVPFVAAYFVWRDRAALAQVDLKPCWLGLGVVLAALAARFYGLLILMESAERYAIVLAIAGLVLWVAGWVVFKRLAWVLVFLLLMVPLPGRVHNLISGPLQTQAARGAEFMLELSGAVVLRAGNVLTVNGVEVGVAEACSGLRMLTAFVIVSATLAYLVRRPPWQKAVVVASSVPIAILCNLIRLFVTASLYGAGYDESARALIHDFPGFAMMPPAVLMLAGELWLMKRLVVPEGADPPGSGSGKARARGAKASKKAVAAET
jgi:exosortase